MNSNVAEAAHRLKQRIEQKQSGGLLVFVFLVRHKLIRQ